MQIKSFTIRLNKAFMEQDEKEMNNFISNLEVIKTTVQLVTNENENYWSVLIFYDSLPENEISSHLYNYIIREYNHLNNAQKKRYDAIIKWRKEEAEKLNIRKPDILQDHQVFEIVKWNYRTLNSFTSISGFGEIRKGKYGGKIIEIMNSILD